MYRKVIVTATYELELKLFVTEQSSDYSISKLVDLHVPQTLSVFTGNDNTAFLTLTNCEWTEDKQS